MIPILSYDAEIQKRKRLNVDAVVKGNVDEKIRIKMMETAREYGITYTQVQEYCKTVPGYAELFAKAPLRQNICEDLAAVHIRRYIADKGSFLRLPQGGNDSWHIVENVGVLREEDLPSEHARGRVVKSLDFAWKSGSTWVFASHKHTGDEGGSQDNQHNDLKAFISAATSLPEEIVTPNGELTSDVVFLAICDGPYYQRTVLLKDGTQPTREEELYHLAKVSGGSSRVHALTVNGIDLFQRQHAAVRDQVEFIPLLEDARVQVIEEDPLTLF